MLKLIDAFSLSDAIRERMSWLEFRGKRTDTLLDDAILGPAFECDGTYVVFIIEDAMTEERLRILYLSRDWKLLDRIEILVWYATGWLTDVAIAADKVLEFSFYGDERWRLTVHHDPKLVITRPWSRVSQLTQSSIWDTFRRRHLELQLTLPRRGRSPGSCRVCGYDMTGNASGACPECGTPVASKSNASA